jgi:hypothetical protein
MPSRRRHGLPDGGPDLTDDIWIYGGDRGAITASTAAGRMDRCLLGPTSSTLRRSSRWPFYLWL